MLFFPTELLAQWLDIIDYDAKLITNFEAITNKAFPISLKTLKKYKEMESAGIVVPETPARKQKIETLCNTLGIELDGIPCFKNEQHLIVYKQLINGIRRIKNRNGDISPFQFEDKCEQLIEEIICFNRHVISLSQDKKPHAWLKSQFLQRYLPSQIVDDLVEFLADKPPSEWFTYKRTIDACILVNVGMVLESIAWIDLEDLYRTDAMLRPESYFKSIMPKMPLHKSNPTGLKIQAWADVMGSIRKSCLGDDNLRITVQKWKSDKERPTEKKLAEWLKNITIFKYPNATKDQVDTTRHNLYVHWLVALLLTNMKNCLIGKKRTSKYSIHEIENKEHLILCFERYDNYLNQAKKVAGL